MPVKLTAFYDTTNGLGLSSGLNRLIVYFLRNPSSSVQSPGVLFPIYSSIPTHLERLPVRSSPSNSFWSVLAPAVFSSASALPFPYPLKELLSAPLPVIPSGSVRAPAVLVPHPPSHSLQS